MKILIDNGHGQDTSGKRSPDGRLREYAYAREIAQMVVDALKSKGYDAQRIVTEENDVSLKERCHRVNVICKQYGTRNVLLVSIHNNAAGADGKWHSACGWSAYTSRGLTKADTLAEHFYDAAEKHLSIYADIITKGKTSGEYDQKQRPIRTDYTDGDRDNEEGFYILKHSACPAVLTENLFQDNKGDVDFLLSENGKQAIIALHVDGIINYINKSL